MSAADTKPGAPATRSAATAVNNLSMVPPFLPAPRSAVESTELVPGWRRELAASTAAGERLAHCPDADRLVSLQPSPPYRAACGRGSVGRASPCQGEGRGFESRRPLQPLVDWDFRPPGWTRGGSDRSLTFTLCEVRTTEERCSPAISGGGRPPDMPTARSTTTLHPSPRRPHRWERKLVEAARDDLEGFLAERMDEVSPATVHYEFRALRSFFGWLVRRRRDRRQPGRSVARSSGSRDAGGGGRGD